MRKYLLIVTALLFITVIIGFEVVWYAQILKWLVFVGACWLVKDYMKINKKIFITFIVIAIFFNPFVPIYFNEIARIVCLITGIIFLPFAYTKFLPIAMKIFKEEIPAQENDNKNTSDNNAEAAAAKSTENNEE